MMLPILISVSVAPVSYFFCASAPLQDAASKTRAAERAAGRSLNAGMLGSPSCENVSLFLIGSAWRLVGAPLNTFRPPPARQSPLRPLSEGAFPASEQRPKDRGTEYQLVTSPLITSPNRSHFSPLNRIICNWLIGAKSVA